MKPEVDRVLLATAVAHLALGLACLAALASSAAPLGGSHPALKPMKFGVSIAIFLATMGLLVPTLSLGTGARRAIAWGLAATMSLEMIAVGAQALRGKASHFNVETALDAGIWRAMVGVVVVATAIVLTMAVVATARPLVASDGTAIDPLLATACRAGLWLFALAAVSGFAMGGRGQHGVGGPDGGEGTRVMGWSTTHGDLRVAHFVSLHALQVLPAIALVLAHAPLVEPVRWLLLGLAILGQTALALGTLGQALEGRSPW